MCCFAAKNDLATKIMRMWKKSEMSSKKLSKKKSSKKVPKKKAERCQEETLKEKIAKEEGIEEEVGKRKYIRQKVYFYI